MNNNSNINTSKGKIYFTVAALAAILMMSFNMNANMNSNMNAYAEDWWEQITAFEPESTGQSLECVIVVVGCDGTGSVGSNGDAIIGSNNGNNNGNDGGGNEQASLAVIKQVRCEMSFELDSEACELALSIATPSAFTFKISGNNPNPDEFSGSSFGTEIRLDAGNYEIVETNFNQIQIQLRSALNIADIVITLDVSGDCSKADIDRAKGDVLAGESQSCTITNVISDRLV